MSDDRTRDPEATRAAILQAAEEVFLDKGFGSTAVSEIAARAGVTKSLIHHHFGSKEQLWTEVKMRRFRQYAEQQMEMLRSAQPSYELLRDSIAVYFNFLKENPEVVRTLAWMYLEGAHDACPDVDEELTEEGSAKLREGQEAGMLRADIDPRFMIFAFIGLAQHWFQNRETFCHHFPAGMSTDELDAAFLDALTKIFFEGVLAR